MVLSILTSIYCIACEIFNSGSDGARTVNYEIMGLSSLPVSLHERQEILDPILFVPQSFGFKGSNNSLSRYSKPRTHFSQEQWQEVALRNASGESLRQLAKIYSVSYEAIRQVIKKVTPA